MVAKSPQEDNTESNFLNHLKIEPEQTYDTVTKKKVDNYDAMVVTKKVKADIWEYESRMTDIANHKKRNAELMNRMAVNVIKICYMQLPMPTNKIEYGRYLHLRGFYVNALTNDVKKPGRTLTLKNHIKRIDEWFAGVPTHV